MTWNMQRIIFAAFCYGFSVKELAKELEMEPKAIEDAIREVAKS